MGSTHLRSFATAVVAAVFAFLWAHAHGAPRLASRVASIGADPLHARGGVVLDLTVDAPEPARSRALAIALARLDRFGDVTTTPIDGGVRATVLDVAPSQRGAAEDAAWIGGRLALGVVLEKGELVDRIAAWNGDAAVRREIDTWMPEDSSQRHRMPYLVSYDRAALARAVASLGPARDGRIVIELVAPAPDARDPRPYWRTYVIAPDVWEINEHLTGAAPTWDPNVNKPIVQIEFDDAGRARFAALTTEHVGDKIAILLDDEVTSAPVVNGPIRGGTAIITMGGTDVEHMQEEADALVATVRGGKALDVRVHAPVVEWADASPARALIAQLLTAIAAALLVLIVAWPLGRWRGLRAAPVSSGRPAVPSRAGAIVPRALVTLGVLAALAALRAMLVPGVDRELLARIARHGAATLQLSPLALGLAPILLAYLGVELAALVIPGWRARRHGGRGAREPLFRMTVLVAVTLTIVEAWYLAGYLGTLGAEEPLIDPSSLWMVTAVFAAGTALCAGAALAIDRWGLGRGWSAVLALDLVLRVTRGQLDVPWSAWLPVVPAAALAILATRTRAERARLPIAGFIGAAAVPLALEAVWRPLLVIPALRANELFVALARPVHALPIALGLTLVLALIVARALPWPARLRVIAVDLALAAAFAGLPIVLGVAPVAALSGAIVAAAAADALADARARARGAWTPIAELHDVAAADACLDDAAAPRLARGLHVRALLGGAAPMIPVEVIEARPADEQALAATLPAARVVE